MRIHGAHHPMRAPHPTRGAHQTANAAGNDANAADGADPIDPSNDLADDGSDPFADDAAGGAGKKKHPPKKKPKPDRPGRVREPKDLREPKAHRLGRDATFTTDKEGNVTIDATRKDDRINVERDRNGRVVVEVNGAKHAFPPRAIKSLTINGSTGDDRVHIGKGLDLPITVNETRGAGIIKNEADGAIINVGDRALVSNFGDGATIDGGAGGSRIVNRSNGTTIRSQGPILVDSQGALNQINDVFERTTAARPGMSTALGGRPRPTMPRAPADAANGNWLALGVLSADAIARAEFPDS